MTNNQRIKATIFMTVSGIGLALIPGWVLAHVMNNTQQTVWITLSIPTVIIAFLVGWGVSGIEKRAYLRGTDRGVEQVMGAAGRTADLRGQAATATRTLMPREILQQVLASRQAGLPDQTQPKVIIQHRAPPEAGEGGIIDA